MNKFIFGFSIGAIVGSVVTYKLVKDKFEALAQEEIESVKDIFIRRHNETCDEPVDTEQKRADADRYDSKLREHGYVNYSDISKKDSTSTEEKTIDKPYVISPDEFGEMDDYETISLTYYADDVLCDEDDEPVDDIESTVVEDFADHFGEYEDDSVFVRNDRLKCDFEILRDLRKYSEVINERPH